MPSLSYDFLKQLKDDYKKYLCFIETGTLEGGTIFQMEPYFEKLYTVELSDHYYNQTKSRYNGTKINFILGDSSIVFNTLLPTIKDTAIFFLDGHWSSGNTAQGAKDCPLEEEVMTINNHFKQEAIIIIDDCRLFGKSKLTGNNEDWSNITASGLLEILSARISQYYYLDSECSKNDRLIIHLKSIT